MSDATFVQPGPRDDDARFAMEQAWLARLDAELDLTALRSHSHTRSNAPPVILLSGTHPASLDEAMLLRLCTREQSRSGGPGGQNRNKVSSQVHLTHDTSGVCARAGERRSVRENLPIAIWRLRLALAVLVRCPVPAGDARSEVWKRRVASDGKHAGKIVVSDRHSDYPTMLALSLDVAWARDLDHKEASVRLCCTSTQLVRMWSWHAPAMVWINGHRAARSMHPLKA